MTVIGYEDVQTPKAAEVDCMKISKSVIASL